MSTGYDFKTAHRRFLDRMFPVGPQRQNVARMAEGEDDDYETTEVLNGLLQIDEAYFNQSVADRDPTAAHTLYPLIDDLHFKSEIAAIAGRYLETPKLHAKQLSLFLVLALLDTELYPLRRDVRNPIDVLARATENPQIKLILFSRSGFGRVTNWIVSIMLLILALAAFAYDLAWIGTLLAALLIWQAVSVLLTSRRVKKAASLVEGNMTASLRSLELIRSELVTGGFDADAMRQRLQRAEQSGLYVPSLVYPLLQLTAPRHAVAEPGRT